MSTNTKMAEAIELAEDAMAYVPEYFANKHGMNRRMAALKEAAAHDAEQAQEPISYLVRARWPDRIEEYLEVRGVTVLGVGKVGIDVDIPKLHPFGAAPVEQAQPMSPKCVSGTSEQSAKAVPAGMVLVPVEVLEDAATAIGHFVSDHGWADEDMQAMDNLDAYIARHKANAAAPATPAATPSPAPAMGRDAFEAWAANYSTIPLERDDDDRLGITGYTVLDQTMLWDAWQAAMTRARAAVESVPVPRTWDFATSRHSWVTSQDLDDYRVAVLRALGGK